MYFVDREKIEQLLQYMENLIKDLPTGDIDTKQEKYTFERIAHMLIESMLDVGNAMIDGFIMRDPGSYNDIIDILLDEKVIQQEEADALKEIVAYRKVLVQEYLEINHKEALLTFSKQKQHLIQYPKNVRRYLDEELGPVSAFKN